MKYMPIPDSDPNNVRLKVAFILIWLFAACVFAFSQDKPKRYRVRAVHKLYYVPDTVYWGQDLQVYSPYLDTILFKLESVQGFPLVVFTRTYQTISTSSMQPGLYKWQLIYRDEDGKYQTDNGRLIIK